jgi:OmpA-OmpF porin, OOP family
MNLRFSHHLMSISMVVLLFGNARAQAQDVPGAKDHPLASRYPGSVLNAYAQEQYTEIEIVRAQRPLAGAGRKYGEVVGGRLTGIGYLGPKERSPQDIFRYYERALASGGFAGLYKCELEACLDRGLVGRSGYVSQVIARRLADARWSKAAMTTDWTEEPSYFLSAQLKRPGGDAYYMLWVTPGYAGGDQAGIFQFVLEAKAMDAGVISVDATTLEKNIATDGKTALYGIYFDAGKADIKPESKSQMDEVAKLLTQNGMLRVSIVSHTDNQGIYDANVVLSQRRAEAVVNALITNYKVDPKRLKAFGAASIAPVATNRSEAGRSKNRRIEIVEQ